MLGLCTALLCARSHLELLWLAAMLVAIPHSWPHTSHGASGRHTL